MSIFRVNNFWTLDLSQLLPSKVSGQEETLIGSSQDSGSKHDSRANFIFRTGNFQSIGLHDVFVCASLDGFICVVQVPISSQSQLNESSVINNTNRADTIPSDNDDIQNRQLLLTKQLEFPIVDLECGFFLSSFKQSIAVLTFDQVVFYQVRQREDKDDPSQSRRSRPSHGLQQSDGSSDSHGLLFHENLFSHKLEERLRLNLGNIGLASNLVVSKDHYNSSDNSDKKSSPQYTEDDINDGVSPNERTGLVRNRIQQRATLIIQYTNQFIFTVIENKKITGQFWLHRNDSTTEPSSVLQPDDSSKDHLDFMAEHMGRSPMALVSDSRQTYLSISFTDQTLYTISWPELMTAAKMSTVRKVAQNLFYESQNHQESTDSKEKTYRSKTPSGYIHIDLSSITLWTRDLVHMPIDIIAIQRSKHPSLVDVSKSFIKSDRRLHQHGLRHTGQLLITSRYCLDLFSCSGDHLWSHKFESPLICVSSYIKPGQRTEDESMMTLVCVDCLSENRSNLYVFDEDSTVWFAVDDMKPVQMCRSNLSQLSGCLVFLDAKESRLSVSYLGTNEESKTSCLQESSEGPSISMLENLEEENFKLDQQLQDQKNFGKSQTETSSSLDIEVKLEATEQWPNTRVDCTISIRAQARSSRIIHNLITILEFDELIHFEPKDQLESEELSSSPNRALKFDLGNCWPDRREPFIVSGVFSLASSIKRSITTNEFEDNEYDPKEPLIDKSRLLPKTGQVNIYLRYHENKTGPLVQEEIFLLPISLFSSLAQVEYTNQLDQNLRSYQATLSQADRLIQMDKPQRPRSSGYLIDFVLNTSADFSELLNYLIESDIICRGLELSKGDITQVSDEEVIEKMSLLSQSLDCRLKFKSLTHSKPKMKRTDSETQNPIVIASIALKMQCKYHTVDIETNGKKPTNSIGSSGDQPTIAWIHVCDLNRRGTLIGEELVKQHMESWKVYHSTQAALNLSSDPQKKVMVSIECESLRTILFIQAHLYARLEQYLRLRTGENLMLNQLYEPQYDSIEIDYGNLFRINSFISLSSTLHESFKSILSQYNTEHHSELDKLSIDFQSNFKKFKTSTTVLLSNAKRLTQLPAERFRDFDILTQLVDKYQLNLLKNLDDLEELKSRDYLYNKLADARSVSIEMTTGQRVYWPNIQRLLD